MLQLAHKIFLYAFAIVPVAVLIYWYAMVRRRKAIRDMS